MQHISNLEIRNALRDLHREGHLTMHERDELHGRFGDSHEIDHSKFKEITKAIKTDSSLTGFQRQKVLDALNPLTEKRPAVERPVEQRLEDHHEDHLGKAA